MSRITSDNVRNRLKNLTSVDISDNKLEDISYIPTAEARVNIILSNNGLSYDSLSDDKKTLIKAAEIELAAMVCLIEAPVENFQTGQINSKAASGSDIEKMIEILDKNYKKLLSLAGASYIVPSFTSLSSDDYKPDGSDATNLILGDTEEDVYSINQ